MSVGSRGLTPIERCRSCGSRELSTFLSLGDLPLSNGLLSADQLATEEPRYPLDVALCGGCSLVQIMHTVPPEELFGADYPYLSSFTDAVVHNAAQNVEMRLRERQLGRSSLVVEPASNDGYLLQHYAAAGVPVLGIDPTPEAAAAARARGVETIEDFFGRGLADQLVASGRRADVIHANNVLAHVADTNDFVAGIAALLKPDGIAVIEVPYVRELIDRVEYDTVYHEHLCYFSVTAVDRLLRRHGLFLNRVERLPIHGGSLRLFAAPIERPEAAVRELIESERAEGLTDFAYYRDFSGRVLELRNRLQGLIGQLKDEGASIAGYGAAAKGTILLNHAGLGPEAIDFVVDRNTFKQGKWVPGVRLPILPPSAILERQPNFVLILAWNFKHEIMAQQADYAKRGGRFIVPVPVARRGGRGMNDGDACRACHGRDLRGFYRVDRVPVHSCLMVDTREEAVGFPCGDVDLAFCQSCGFIQNRCFDPSLQAYSPAYEETQFFSPQFRRFLKATVRRSEHTVRASGQDRARDRLRQG